MSMLGYAWFLIKRELDSTARKNREETTKELEGELKRLRKRLKKIQKQAE